MNQLKDKFLASGEKVLNAHVLELSAFGALVGQVSLDILRRNPVAFDMILNQYIPISLVAAVAIGTLGMLYFMAKKAEPDDFSI